MEEQSAKYQVTGMAAFQRYSLETQVPNEITVFNTVLSGKRTIAGLSFVFIRVAPERLGGDELFSITTETGTPISISISSLPRTLLDAVYDYEIFGTIPRAYSWIASKQSDRNTIRKLVEMTLAYGNVGTKRRLGYVLDSLKVNPRWLNKLRAAIPRATSLIPLIPGKPARGFLDRKWGVIVNGEIPALAT
ncbi:MAG: hypothetical protein V1495_00830 [Pseudomonadota bacterium]